MVSSTSMSDSDEEEKMPSIVKNRKQFKRFASHVSLSLEHEGNGLGTARILNGVMKSTREEITHEFDEGCAEVIRNRPGRWRESESLETPGANRSNDARETEVDVMDATGYRALAVTKSMCCDVGQHTYGENKLFAVGRQSKDWEGTCKEQTVAVTDENQQAQKLEEEWNWIIGSWKAKFSNESM